MKILHPNSSKNRPLGFRYRLYTVLLSFFLFLLPVHNVLDAEQSGAEIKPLITTGEYELKAVYLFNFLQFTSWPGNSAQTYHHKRFVIGIIGQSPFGNALDDLKAGLAASGQADLEIIYFGSFQNDMDFSRCHLLFVSRSEEQNTAAIVTSLAGAPILTVADHDHFLQSGGMINLIRHGDKIRWEINRTPVAEAGLHLNAKLLDIAVTIVYEPPPLKSTGSKAP